MDVAEAWARTQGYRLLTLNAFAENSLVRSFYNRLRYEEDIIKYKKRLT